MDVESATAEPTLELEDAPMVEEVVAPAAPVRRRRAAV